MTQLHKWSRMFMRNGGSGQVVRRALRLHSDTARDYLVAYAREEVMVACVLALGHPRFTESQRCGKTCKRTGRDIEKAQQLQAVSPLQLWLVSKAEKQLVVLSHSALRGQKTTVTLPAPDLCLSSG